MATYLPAPVAWRPAATSPSPKLHSLTLSLTHSLTHSRSASRRDANSPLTDCLTDRNDQMTDTHSPTHSLTHSLTHTFIPSFLSSLPHSRTHALTHSRTHSHSPTLTVFTWAWFTHSLTHSLSVTETTTTTTDDRQTTDRQTGWVLLRLVVQDKRVVGRSVIPSLHSVHFRSHFLYPRIQQFNNSKEVAVAAHARTHARTHAQHSHTHTKGRQAGSLAGSLAGWQVWQAANFKLANLPIFFLPACLPACLPSFLPALHSPTKPAQTQTLRKDAAPPGPSPAQRGPAQPKGKNGKNERRKEESPWRQLSTCRTKEPFVGGHGWGGGLRAGGGGMEEPRTAGLGSRQQVSVLTHSPTKPSQPWRRVSERASEPKRKPKPNKPASQPVSQPAIRQRSESGRDRKCESAKTKRKTADCQFDTVTSHLHAFTLSLSYAFIHAFTLSRATRCVQE